MSSPAVPGERAPDLPRDIPATKGYSVPGEGRSTLISLVTVCGLFAL